MKQRIDKRNPDKMFPGMIVCPQDGYRYFQTSNKCLRCMKCFGTVDRDMVKSSTFRQATEYRSPAFKVQTATGLLKYEAWLLKEKERYFRNGTIHEAEIRVNSKDLLALFVKDLTRKETKKKGADNGR